MENKDDLKNEIIFYTEINRNFEKIAPNFIKHFPSENIILLEFIQNSKSLFSILHDTASEETIQNFKTIGKNLAITHSLKPINGEKNNTELPWIFNIHHPNTRLYSEFNNKTIEIVKILQSQRQYSFLLSEASYNWNNSSFIHGDFKDANTLIKYDQYSGANVYFVDWEFSGFGDACWDVGCFFSDLLLFWLTSFPIVSTLDIEDLIKFSESTLEKIRKAASIFMESYKLELKLKENDFYNEKFLIKSIKYTAIRNLQRLLENLISGNHLDRRSVLLIQISLNLLQNPVFSIEKIFKLSRL